MSADSCLVGQGTGVKLNVNGYGASLRWLVGTVGVYLLLVLPGAARAQLTNSWIYDGSFFWDNTNVWSLGVAPSNNQSAVLITNTISGGSFKSVNLDSSTPSGTMTISNLTVSAPAGLTNRLSLNRVGATPLRILNGFTIGAGGELFATNSTVLVEGVSGGNLGVDGGINLVSGGTTVVFTLMRLGNFACTTTGVVSIAGGSLFVTNAAGNAVLEVRSGTLTFSAGSLKADQLVVTNACARFIHTGGSLVVGTVTVDPNLDADGDGLPNGWESKYGLDQFDPTGANGASGDPDADGMTNLQEFQAGSNPVADIKSIAREGNNVRVTWGAFLGKTNALQAASSLAVSFGDVHVINNATGTVTNYLDIGGATNKPSRFYRVRLTP